MTSRKHVLRGLIVPITAALAIAGCGSSSRTTTPPAAATTGAGSTSAASSTAATGSEIVIGNVGGYTGAQASSQGGVPKMLKAWASWVNAHGGVSGHPVKLVVKDLGSNLTGGLAAVKELVEQDHVVAIVGEQDNGDSSWASYVAGKGVPVIGGLSIDLPFVTNPDFFAAGTNIFASIYGVQMLAKSFGPKFGLLYCAESPQCAGADPINKGLAQATGLQIPVSAKVAATAPNYTAVCQQLKSAGVSSYEVGSGSAIVLRIAHECAANGVKAKQVTEDGTITSAWLKEPAVDGALSAELDFPFYDTSVPASQEMQQALQQYAPDLGDLNGPNASYSWVAGKLFEKAVSAIPSGTAVTPQSIKTGLYTLKDETLGGLAPPLTFTEGKPAVVNCYFVVGISGGKFVEPQGLKTSCAPDAVVTGVLASLAKG
jgi:branched-chain amino acid transport system substrate-binding protein